MARIVTLGPVSNTSVTFEEAFGEYSEARGKGRERRKKRKLERIENRREVKQARTEARDEVKGDRQDARISRRERRKSGRQAIRTEQSQARQGRRTGRQAERQVRRTTRTEGRLGRKELRRGTPEDLDQGLDTATPQEMGGARDLPEQPIRETDQLYNDENQGQDSISTPEGGYEGGYESESSQGGYQGGGYDAGPEEGAPYENEYYEDEYYQEEPESGEGVYDEEGDYIGDESGYLNDYQASDDFNFDGVMGAEDRFNEMTGPQSINVDSDVQDVFSAWLEVTGRDLNKTKLDSKRASRIVWALKNYPKQDVVDAVRGWRNSKFHSGANERGKVYNDLTLLLRDAQHLEEFRELERTGGKGNDGVKAWNKLRQLLEEEL